MKRSGLLRAEDGVLGRFGDLELHNALGRNLDLLAGGRVTAEAGGAVLQLQLAKAGQRESVLGVFVGQISERLEILDGLLFGDADLLSERRSDLGFRERFSHSIC